MKQYWETKKNEPIAKLKRHLQDQLNRFGNRHFASKHLQDATKEQNRWNYMEAKRVRDELVRRIDNGDHIDPNIDIQTMFRPKPAHMRERIKQD